ncbi:MAG: outer membrane lipoprotein carrier protein LolA [Treponema sp.]|nr:outer membrane lipoprotein carrier protein LolA [Treponema sp.]
MKNWLFMLILTIFIVFDINPQDIITADRYLEMVSERYSSIRDFETYIVIQSGGREMYGHLSYLTPMFLRIDFTRPSEQVIMFNGELLTVYLPEYRAVLNQNITRRSGSGGGGLVLFRRNYAASFVTGPDPVPLEGTQETVVKLRLIRRSASEGYREIILSINPSSRLIRRIEGRTTADGLVQFDFSNIRINQGIPALRFVYDSPPTANVYNNFLFRDTD